MSTKTLILHTAIELFNQYGTAKVSTNHIAKEAGISPGNLYYHYKDKAHIIREIYEQMSKEWEMPYQRAEGQTLSIRTLERFVQDTIEMLWRYRFSNREMVALLKADSVLAERHAANSKEYFERLHLLFQQAVKEGVLSFPEPEVQLDEVLTIAWIIANYYLIHLEAMGQRVEQSDFNTGAELLLKVFYPYMR